MEESILTDSAALSPQTTPEVSTNNKPDCYFYYYSSCNKGNACPYRHEPAALRNETMCLYWLKGSCNKPNCIYRHMEITKKRDKIPCFFESQPQGCKKLHCPFLHNNVLDQLRDEDVPKHPDLILPVKDSEAEYETEESEVLKLQESVAAQLKVQRNLSSQHSNLKESETSPESPTPCITRKSFIVPLQDGESDSESATMSPVKALTPTRRCVVSEAERDWELERLREIQKEEGNLLGYSFTNDHETSESNEEMSRSPVPVSYTYEEVEEYIEEDEQDSMSQTILRKSFPKPKRNTDGVEERRYIKKVLGSVIKKNVNDKFNKLSSHDMLVDSDAEDYMVISNSSSLQDGLQSGISERLGPKHNLLKPSVKERLGHKKMREMENDTENKPKRNTILTNYEESIRKRLGSKPEGVKSRITLHEDKTKSRIRLNEDKTKSRISLNEDKTKSRITLNEEIAKRKVTLKDDIIKDRISLKDDPIRNRMCLKDDLKQKEGESSFVIKSLADIRAEKERQKRTTTTNSRAATHISQSLPLSALINRKKEVKEKVPDVGSLKIKTLAEIKAEKEKSVVSVHEPRKKISLGSTKRSFSPITFESSSSKKLKVNQSVPRTNHKKEIEQTSTPTSFSPRKLSFKRSNNGVDNINNRHNSSSSPSHEPVTNNWIVTPISHQINDTDTERPHPTNNGAPNKEQKDESNTHTLITRNDLDTKLEMTKNQELKPNVNRLDSFLDEEQLLLDEDIIDFDDEDIDEDELLL